MLTPDPRPRTDGGTHPGTKTPTSAVTRQYRGLWARVTLWAAVLWLVALIVQPPLRFTYGPNHLRSTLEDEQLHGFHVPETDPYGQTFVWTEPRAYVPLDYHTSRPLSVTLQLRSAAVAGGPDAPVIVRANTLTGHREGAPGLEVARLRPDPANTAFQDFTVRVVPPPGARQLVLEIEASSFSPPGDSRALGTMIKGLTLDKSEAWSVVERRFLLYWLLPVLAALAGGLLFAAQQTSYRNARVARFLRLGALAACGLGALLSAACLALVLWAGPLDWATFALWLGATLFATLAFLAAALALAASVTRRAITVAPAAGRFARSALAFALRNRTPTQMWLGWRIALTLIPLYAGAFFVAAGPSPARPFSPNVWMDRLVWAWTRWDGLHYLNIASHGYSNSDLVNFYPLYPVTVRLASFPLTLGDSSFAALAVVGIVVSSLSTLVACGLLYRLALREYGADAARLSVLYLLSFPAAFFLFAVYTEALFLALAVGAFYAARTRRWALALALAALATLSKNQGIIVALALFVEYLHQIGWSPRKIDRRVVLFALPALAYGGWIVYNGLAFGNLTQFVEAARDRWKHELAWPWQTLADAASGFFGTNDSGTWLPNGLTAPVFYEFPLTVAFLVLALVALFAMFRRRLRPAYFVFVVACLLQPLVYPVVDNDLISMPRYELIIFPAFFLFALAGARSKIFHYAYLSFSLPLLGLSFARFVLWYWVA